MLSPRIFSESVLPNLHATLCEHVMAIEQPPELKTTLPSWPRAVLL
jgi:hypothetical protein